MLYSELLTDHSVSMDFFKVIWRTRTVGVLQIWCYQKLYTATFAASLFVYLLNKL